MPFETIARSSVVSSFVLLVFDYCDIVWAPNTVSLSNPLERLHSCILQQVPNCNSFVKLTLAECRHFHTVVQVFKVLYQLYPGYLSLYLKDCIVNFCCCIMLLYSCCIMLLVVVVSCMLLFL